MCKGYVLPQRKGLAQGVYKKVLQMKCLSGLLDSLDSTLVVNSITGQNAQKCKSQF